MAVKIAEACTYVLPFVTTLGVLHEYGRVYVTCFLVFFYRYNIFFGGVYQLYFCNVRMKRCLHLGYFSHLGVSEELLRLADIRLRISCLALKLDKLLYGLIPALVL